MRNKNDLILYSSLVTLHSEFEKREADNGR